MAYCQQMSGNTAEAIKIYNSVLKNKPSDGAVSAVAANNTVTINQVMYHCDNQPGNVTL